MVYRMIYYSSRAQSLVLEVTRVGTGEGTNWSLEISPVTFPRLQALGQPGSGQDLASERRAA